MAAEGTALEVLLAFLRMGCMSFGGPVAHIGYFRAEFVARRGWCSDREYAEMVGLAQSLPGPSSSQVGFALGLLRAGWWGGLAAWVGFTLPSALLMLAFATFPWMFAGRVGGWSLHGLQLVAVAVVLQAVVTMKRSLAPSGKRLGIALLAAVIAFFVAGQLSTFAAIVFGGVAGLLWLRGGEMPSAEEVRLRVTRMQGVVAAIVFAVLLLAALVYHPVSASGMAIFAAMYRSGGLVFGGGHVVLPLLEGAVVARGWVSQSVFLAGYGAAQALPGPLFVFGGYLGAAAGTLRWGVLGLVGIFAPGLLAMGAVLPFWKDLRRRKNVGAALAGINASVVGVLAVALYRPLWIGAVHSVMDVALALGAFALLMIWKTPPWVVVVCVLVASVGRGLLLGA